ALAPITADQARTAAVEFLTSRKAIDSADTVSATQDGDVITVVFDQPVREFTGEHRAHDRAELTYDRAGRGLLSVRMS
ncbi:hypothetical protein K7G98_37895, partial [Saccharothrix sp. MB29]|nr:hypothetical protein [Saccharothrix sp. MB29]